MNHDPTEQIAAAESRAGEEWADKAVEVLRLLALSQPELTSGDAWPYLGMPPGGEGRAIGGPMRRAVALGYIEKTTKTVDWKPYLPEMKGNLGRTTTVWRSLIYEEGDQR